jgi:hypothetical protein
MVIGAIAVIDSIGKARLWSRNRCRLERKFPTVRDVVKEVKLRSAIADWTTDKHGHRAPIRTEHGKAFCCVERSTK